MRYRTSEWFLSNSPQAASIELDFDRFIDQFEAGFVPKVERRLIQFAPLARLLDPADIKYAEAHGRRVWRLPRAIIAARYCATLSGLAWRQVRAQQEMVQADMADFKPAFHNALAIGSAMSGVWLSVLGFMLHSDGCTRRLGNAIGKLEEVFRLPAVVLEFHAQGQ